MNTVLSYLRENRHRLEPGPGNASRLSCLIVTPRFRASSHVVFLLLAEGRRDPIWVAKLPRLAGRSVSLEKTVANLRAVHAGKPGGFDSIPRVIAYEEYHGRPILLLTALAGTALDPALVRRDPTRCCESVLAWLGDMDRPRTPRADDLWFERLVHRPLDLFGKTFPLSDEEAACLARTEKIVAILRESSLPLVFEHGDLSSPNVMRLHGGGIGVVDWELAEPQGLPAGDLFFFLTYVAFARHNARRTPGYLTAFQEAFFGPRAWALPHIRTYAARLAVPGESLTPLFVLCWARYLAGLVQRLQGEHDSRQPLSNETAHWLRQNRY
ncbi:MAG: aminoglycoside phosphotransferase family protein, partial [Pirellulales bacterium]|nr:aminoglycoside phosphotransferase family protein [Pirellulales bacterium]